MNNEKKQEIWKDIVGYEGLYQVSNLGRIKSLIAWGRIQYVKREKIIKLQKNNRGYLYCRLRKNKTPQKFYVHRLVAIAFIPNYHNKSFVNHKDCNPLNNCVENLEWCTPKENSEYMVKMGRNKKTEIWNDRIKNGLEKYKKSVIGINKKTNEIRKYECLIEVKKDGFRPGDVCKCCKGERKSAGGYIWRYANDRNSERIN